MGRSRAKTLVWFATFTKILPLLLGVGTLLIASVWTRGFLPAFLGPLEILYGITFLYIGLMFTVVEASFALPEAGKSNAGVFGAVLLIALGIGAFAFSGTIFFGIYDPIQDEGTINVAMSILLIISIGMFIVQAREEIFHHKRLSYHSKLKSTLG